jgi:hypothetical protein
MTEADILAAIQLLPEPDLIEAGKITDPIGSRSYYSARTVAKLLLDQEQQIEARRLEKRYENRR